MFRNCYIKKISLFIISISCIWSLASCEDDDIPTGENVPEYYENYSSGSDVSSTPSPVRYLNIYSTLKVKTEKAESKNIELKFTSIFEWFPIEEPNLDDLSVKEVVGLYSDLSQKINYSVTRYIYSGKKTINLRNYYFIEREEDNKLSKEIVYSKEDTLGYFVSEFNDDFVSSFTISYDDLDCFLGKQFCVLYLLTIKPVYDNEIKLMRPASKSEVNGLYKGTAEIQGISAGDSISYVYFKKDLEKEFKAFNYVNFYANDDKIIPLPYEKLEENLEE